MRGDSLRDLYAKTLAIAGLALIAGAGAIVDYWPVAAPVPAVKSPRLPSPAVGALAARFDQKIPAPRRQTPIVVRGTIHARNVGTAKFLPPAPAPVTTPAATATSATTAEPLPVLNATVLPVDELVLALLATPSPELAWQVAPASTSTSMQQPGFIGGALRKTKDSIVKAGAATGATIADGLRGVVGAFRKVTPF